VLASALAKLTGETKTEAVTQALRERLERVRRARARKRLADELDELFISRAQLSLVPVDEDHAHLARDAFRKYGKGRHPAGLDYGDCFSYALARSRDEPLLFKGNDFSKTDVECRPASG
jgi:ribonuclease VapC